MFNKNKASQASAFRIHASFWYNQNGSNNICSNIILDRKKKPNTNTHNIFNIQTGVYRISICVMCTNLLSYWDSWSIDQQLSILPTVTCWKRRHALHPSANWWTTINKKQKKEKKKKKNKYRLCTVYRCELRCRIFLFFCFVRSFLLVAVGPMCVWFVSYVCG